MINRKHSKKESFARRFVDAFSDFFSFSGQETVLVAFLAVSLTFLSAFTPRGVEKIQPPSPTDLPTVIERFGFPFESLRRIHTYLAGSMPADRMSGDIINVTIGTEDIGVEWLGLMVNLVVYALPLVVIIKVVARIREEIDYRRYGRT